MAVTQAQLITGARTAAGMQVDGSLTTTEWQALSDRALEAFWIDVLAINNTLRVSTQTFTITNTSTPYAALNADFMAALRLFKDFGTSGQVEVFRSGAESNIGTRTFKLEGSNIMIDPFEKSAGTYTLKYNPLPVSLGTADLDAELAPHREYLELHMAIAALSAEESSIGDLAPRFKVCQERAIAWAARQRSSQSPKIRDVRSVQYRRGY